MVVGSRGHATRIRAVIDTGFTGHLTLPHDIVRDLDLPLLGSRYVTLADGVTVSLDVHRATVLWHGGEHRPVRAFVAHGDALVGMALLRGSEIRIEAADGGEVAIRPLT